MLERSATMEERFATKVADHSSRLRRELVGEVAEEAKDAAVDGDGVWKEVSPVLRGEPGADDIREEDAESTADCNAAGPRAEYICMVAERRVSSTNGFHGTHLSLESTRVSKSDHS